LGYTNQLVKELVLSNLEKSRPVEADEWVNGPRYCPSLEAKILRFGHLNHRVSKYS
jgi:tRNA U34 5-carboxymethylaminomethyl modifying enzyme MnmG/GidA